VKGRGEVPGFYERERRRFRLFGGAGWRTPQVGGLTAAAAHWTLDPRHPAVVSIPTGAGKTALAMAAPFVAPRPPRRVLVVVPSADLRRQTVERFSSQKDLLGIKAIEGLWEQAVKVTEVDSMIESWDELRPFDVVVALPNTISPHHYEANPPPADLFDLVIVDEAHHASAATWLAILEHFSAAFSLLLTATPARRDGRRIPGKHVYHYPLRLALESGIYKPVEPVLLEPGRDRRASDRRIAEACAEILKQRHHKSSTLIVRADSIERADGLVELYNSAGIQIQAVHGRVGERQRTERIAQLGNGTLRGVAVVGMLGEGFDLPSIRVLAYHDKHKSLPATIQLIGRLARVSEKHPQPSHLVTVRDLDVFPELQGVVRDLYDEDPDWLTVLPKIVDAEIAEDQANAEFAGRFVAAESEIDPRHLWPLLRSVVYEVERRNWNPFFVGRRLPTELTQGRTFAGGEIVFARADADQAIFVLVVRHTTTPTWTTDRAVQNVEYALHLVAFRKAPRGKKDLLFINADNDAALNLLEAHLGLDGVAKPVGPELIDGWVNSLERHSVSAVGVRNVNAAGRGTVGYKNYLGSGVHRGLRAADTHRAALGHGNLQIALDQHTSTNAGFAVEKSKIWFQRYEALRTFVGWVADASQRFWYPTVSASGPLLPGVDRGRRMAAWPSSQPIAIEMNARVFGESLEVRHRGRSYSLEEVELRFVEPPFVDGRNGALQFEAVVPGNPEEPDSAVRIWHGSIATDGIISSDQALAVHHGYASQADFAQVLRSHPPTVFFLDGSQGGRI
jgi:superfamily II DNA or RNA helicase